jgi:UDP-glucose-4-epimerase GalE
MDQTSNKEIMKKIIVTGGAGYIGAHVVKKLIEGNQALQIHVIDNFSQTRANVLTHKHVVYHEIDIREKDALYRVFDSIKPDAVLHFAALASVPDSVINPATYFDTNVTGSMHVLDAMRRTECSRIVFSSSASVYGEPQTDVITEDHPKNPTNPYGYTKLVVEHMLKAYHRAYGISSISFRYFCAAGNEPSCALGEHHTPETHAIPALIETALGIRKEFNIYGDDFPTVDGTGVRDYIHVDDLADAHIKALVLLEEKSVCSQYNLGINKGFSVKELIEGVEKIVGHSLPVVVKDRRVGDPSKLVADATRAMRDLNWSPRYTDIRSIIITAYNAFKLSKE